MEPEMCIVDDGAAYGWAELRYLLTFTSEDSVSERGLQSFIFSSFRL